MARFVLADASPIIGLSRVGGRLALLERLFGQVHITRQVRRDVLPGTGKPGERRRRKVIALRGRDSAEREVTVGAPC